MKLLLSCTKKKNWNLGTGPASKIYLGDLFYLGLHYAKLTQWDVLIFSAKYGWIKPETVISCYDDILTKPHDEPWPEGYGLYLGGQLYFKNCPIRFQALIPKEVRKYGIGQQRNYMIKLIKEQECISS